MNANIKIEKVTAAHREPLNEGDYIFTAEFDGVKFRGNTFKSEVAGKIHVPSVVFFTNYSEDGFEYEDFRPVSLETNMIDDNEGSLRDYIEKLVRNYDEGSTVYYPSYDFGDNA